MTYYELLSEATAKLRNREITNQEYVNMMKPLENEICEWIPVSERLPEKDGIYLICTSWDYHNMDVLIWADGWNCIRHINGKVDRKNEIDLAEILAWMPLPEPYEGGDDKYVD